MKFGLVFMLLLGSLFISSCDRIESSSKVGSGEVFEISDIENQIQYQKGSDIETVFQKDKSRQNLLQLIEYYRSDFQYQKALESFKTLIETSNDRDRKKFLQIILNDANPEPAHYENVQKLLDNYKKEGTIKNEDAYFFQFTLDLLSGSFQKEAINGLTGSYSEFKNTLWAQFDQYYSYTDSPSYYRDALLAIGYFKYQYFGVVKTLANKVIVKNPDYILPYQLKAYSALLTKDFETAKSSLDILMQIDSSKLEWYQFLLGLVYYNNKEYSLAKNYFLQTKSPILRSESLRYTIIMDREELQKLKNDQKEIDKRISSNFTALFDTGPAKEVDYQSYFDWLFYDRIYVGSGGLYNAVSIFSENQEYYDELLKRCFEELKESDYICNYGKVIQSVVKSDHKIALRELMPLVKKYPQRQIYYVIGLLYAEQGLLENSKVYLSKALQSIDVGQKKKMSDILLDLLNSTVTQ